MMAGAIAFCSRTEWTALLNHANFCDIRPPSSFGKRNHPTCKVVFKDVCENNIMLFHHTGRKVAPRLIAYGVSQENSDAENMSSHFFVDDSVLSPSEGNCYSEESGKKTDASLERSGTDLQSTVSTPGNGDSLLDKLKAVQLHILAMEQWNASRIKICHRNYLLNATNLIHYLALKGLNMGQMQEELSSVGLLDLESMRPYVLSSISACIEMLTRSRAESPLRVRFSEEGPATEENSGYLKEVKDIGMMKMVKSASRDMDQLLGTFQGQRNTGIMVTVGQEVLENDTLIPELINAGTSLFRINCAHGNPEVWSEMIRRMRRSSQLLEKPCRILMDLAGPKLRTGKMHVGPCVVKISPKRDADGAVVRPAQVWLSPRGAGPPPPHLSPDVILHVDSQEFLSKLEPDDSVRFSDTRGKRRTLRILSKYPVFAGVGYIAECSNSAYVESGTMLYSKGKGKGKGKMSSVGFVVDVPPAEQFVRLRVGDMLIISRDCSDEQNKSSSSATGTHRITCPSGYLFDSVKPRDPIAFDDGKIWGVIKGASISEVVVSITHAGPKGSKLGSEKSINIPESDIRYEGLTLKDLMDLDFVGAHADMVGVSFIRDIGDIVLLRHELAKRKLSKLGIVLKIETKGGFEKLPLLLLEAMKSPNPLAVMIARGDLAVECGWENLADIQEEILSICGAAHVPVILATQVLESLLKSGVPSRAEIVDAANGRRASCVMLNKGKNILKAVSTLDAILNSQQNKATIALRPLMLSSHAD